MEHIRSTEARSAEDERSGFVLLVEMPIARFVNLAVENALLDEELRPLEVAVAGEQRVIEIEERELH